MAAKVNRPCASCGKTHRKFPDAKYCMWCEARVMKAMIGSGYLQALPKEPGKAAVPHSERRREWNRLRVRHT